MAINKYTYYILFFTFLLSANRQLLAQSVEIKTDRNQILIGERIEYELLIRLPAQGYTSSFLLPDSLPHFEILHKAGVDSAVTNSGVTISRKLIFTSFDSGAWYIPSMPVSLGAGNELKKFMTDSVLINVGYSAADTTGALRDIKPIIEVNVKDYFWYYVAGVILFVLLIATLVFRHFKNKKLKPVPVMYSRLSPFDEAMNDLKALGNANLVEPSSVRQFYSQLTFILKRYYSRTTDINLLNRTTDGLLLAFKQHKREASIISTTAEVLRISDAVKFAKYIPPVSTSESCLQSLKDTIGKLDLKKQTNNN